MSFPILDGLVNALLKRPLIAHPLFSPTESTLPIRRRIHVAQVPTSGQPRLLGSNSFDMFQNQRFPRREPIKPGPTAPVKTFHGLVGTNPTYSEPFMGVHVAGVKAGDFGNLPPRESMNTQEQPRSLVPVKTF